MAEPKPCFICGKTPIVGSFPLMDMRHGAASASTSRGRGREGEEEGSVWLLPKHQSEA